VGEHRDLRILERAKQIFDAAIEFDSPMPIVCRVFV